MNVFQIKGGNRLQGKVDVAGSKNTALAIMSAVVLAEGETVLHNIPNVSDTRIKASLLEKFGAIVRWEGTTLYVDCSNMRQGLADEETVRAIRTSFYLLGPLMARIGAVEMPAPGGCKIGARPVDFHLKGLALLGATVDLSGGVYRASSEGLKGAEIYLDFPSAGATQHLMTTATLAQGHTIIQNAAMEPEVVALAAFLNCLGARIQGAGSSTITIEGVEKLRGCEFRIPADRMQAATYLLAGAITKGDITVCGILPSDQTPVVNKLREAGAQIEEGHDWIRIVATKRLRAIKVKTMPHPGFPTDMQQPMAALLTLANGTSIIDETIYESRHGHVPELERMGANIRIEGRAAIITGTRKLKGAKVEASDLRAGAALVLAGLAAEGETIVRNIHFIDRGYAEFEQTLRSLGAEIERVPVASLVDEE